LSTFGIFFNQNFKYLLFEFFTRSGNAWSPSWSEGSCFLAEFGSLHLEFEALSFHLGDPKYVEKVDQINKVILNVDTSQWDGLFPTAFNPSNGHFTNRTLSYFISLFDYCIFRTQEIVVEIH
jgi:mannosyl-oligosaccharide alpha-1,2-mannosidase